MVRSVVLLGSTARGAGLWAGPVVPAVPGAFAVVRKLCEDANFGPRVFSALVSEHIPASAIDFYRSMVWVGEGRVGNHFFLMFIHPWSFFLKAVARGGIDNVLATTLPPPASSPLADEFAAMNVSS